MLMRIIRNGSGIRPEVLEKRVCPSSCSMRGRHEVAAVAFDVDVEDVFPRTRARRPRFELLMLTPFAASGVRSSCIAPGTFRVDSINEVLSLPEGSES